MFYQTVQQECRARVSGKSVSQECPIKVSHKKATQECPTPLSEKSVKQERSARVLSIAIEHLLFAFHSSLGTLLLRDFFKKCIRVCGFYQFFLVYPLNIVKITFDVHP